MTEIHDLGVSSHVAPTTQLAVKLLCILVCPFPPGKIEYPTVGDELCPPARGELGAARTNGLNGGLRPNPPVSEAVFLCCCTPGAVPGRTDDNVVVAGGDRGGGDPCEAAGGKHTRPSRGDGIGDAGWKKVLGLSFGSE